MNTRINTNLNMLSMNCRRLIDQVWKHRGVLAVMFVIALASLLAFSQGPKRTPSTVLAEVVEKNEMVSVSEGYSFVEVTPDDYNKLFGLIDLPFTGNHFVYRCAGTLRAGVDMRDAKCVQDICGDIVVTLSEPYIISNTPDYEQSGVLDKDNNIFNPIDPEDVVAFQAYLSDKAELDAVQNGLLEKARDSAEKNIREAYATAFGDKYKVIIQWKGNCHAMDI